MSRFARTQPQQPREYKQPPLLYPILETNIKPPNLINLSERNRFLVRSYRRLNYSIVNSDNYIEKGEIKKGRDFESLIKRSKGINNTMPYTLVYRGRKDWMIYYAKKDREKNDPNYVEKSNEKRLRLNKNKNENENEKEKGLELGSNSGSDSEIEGSDGNLADETSEDDHPDYGVEHEEREGEEDFVGGEPDSEDGAYF
ncbi:hypothetical protein M0812_24623 [Anaeramoeba flamelloides]|uniref:DNA-directed RNA polymerase III subunit n=1 Tax=Anaeramoeba flamelloides TaxID=1746091 RepID=A0AAV7YHL6_9EUKA|nr:hypothetical protein M0812_24623 [Anaeramoeba flamelloides]